MFRKFETEDWMAFGGCESNEPLICDADERICVVIDGSNLNINYPAAVGYCPDDEKGIPVFAKEFATENEAKGAAHAIMELVQANVDTVTITSVMENLGIECIATV